MENEEIIVTEEMEEAGAKIVFEYAQKLEAGWIVSATDAARRAYIAMTEIAHRKVPFPPPPAATDLSAPSIGRAPRPNR